MYIVDTLKYTQIDGSGIYNNYYFLTAHNYQEKQGYIYMYKIKDKTLKYYKKMKCYGFPHGIDINDLFLAYTSYEKIK